MFSPSSQGAGEPGSPPDPRTPPASRRILWAAIDLYGRRGIKATTIKAIAEAAGVSPALVIHHFGTKNDLRDACDREVADFVRRSKTASMRKGPSPIAWSVDAQVKESQPVLRYLSRILVEGSPHLDSLLDELVEDALDYTAEAEDAGWLKRSADPRARIVVLTLWSLGALVLNDQLRRMLDVDLLSTDGDILGYMHPALEIFGGIFNEGFLAQQVIPPETSGTGTTRTTDLPTTDEKGTAS